MYCFDLRVLPVMGPVSTRPLGTDCAGKEVGELKRKFAVTFLAIALGVASVAAPAFAGNPGSHEKNCASHTLKGQCVDP